MPWKEVAKGHFERPFDSIENFHRAIKAGGAPMNREHYSIRVTVAFRLDARSSGDDIPSALRHAWKTMRYDFPQLAACDRSGKYVYDVPDAATLDAWLSKSFIVEPLGAKTPEELYPRLTPIDMAFLYYFPQTSQLMLHVSHWRIDGIGAMYLFNHFFDAVAHPRAVHFGDEGKNLSIGLDEANAIPTHVSSQMDQAATEMVMKFVNSIPSIGLPTKPANTPSGSGRCEIELDQAMSSLVIYHCKARGFSVTVAVHAAIIAVTKQYADKEGAAGNRKYASWTAFDLRRYSPAPYNGTENVVSNFHTGIPTVVVTPSTSFQDNADQLKKQYSDGIAMTGPNNTLFTFLSCYVNKVRTLFTQPPPPPPPSDDELPPPTEPALNSLGLIDHFLTAKHGHETNAIVSIEVVDFWIGVEMTTRQFMCYVWTWQGRMRLSVCYNLAFYDEVFIEEFLAQVRKTLMQGLTI